MHQLQTQTPRTPVLPVGQVKRSWPFRVGGNYLGAMPGEDDIVGSLFPYLFADQVWGDCCAYVAQHVAQGVAQPAPATV